MLFKEFSKTPFTNICVGSSSYNLLPRFSFNLLSRYFQTVQLLQLCISSFCSKSGLVKRLLGLSLVKRGSQWHQKKIKVKKGLLKKTLTKGTNAAASSSKKPLSKGTNKKALAKGKAKTLPKGKKEAASSSKAALTKGKKGKLTKNKLKGLGKMSLEERVEKIAEQTDTAEEAAMVLKENIDQNERGKIWAKHQAALKHDPEAEAQHQQANKTQKGLGSLLWFVQNKSAKYLNVKATFGTTETLTKGEQWHSEAKMLKEFGKEEFAAHLHSGRIQWRADPWTPNIFNYRDLGDQRKEMQVKRQKMYQAGQEMPVTEEGEEDFQKMWHKGVGAHTTEAEVTFSGKGRAALTKGNGKGKPALLAITNGENDDDPEPKEKTEAQKWQQCLTKAQKAKENGVVAVTNMEEALGVCRRAGRLIPAAKKDCELLMKDVQVWVEKLKKMVAKKGGGIDLGEAKELIAKATAKTKALKDETKEIHQQANKAGSTKSTKSKK